ncbi:MAG: hypothetical protein US65_C0031G0007 [Candidatus Yanofskybacteria bacterium GW2011_GWC2_37_9]|uniref:Uncharacterized protein n=1 Tax=Candidatus Yanofskybacteria bacterium GW2011_GWC2_37_9 TaxID=1619028 RepID=A0A0G0I6S0_9BACT|nr:MAG: hypothetical protein US65_C0031G0007 [Candidatus Yanofskybacteria bacterium GW2011_GWC2_37_9]
MCLKFGVSVIPKIPKGGCARKSGAENIRDFHLWGISTTHEQKLSS